MVIDRFIGEYAFLSNFYLAQEKAVRMALGDNRYEICVRSPGAQAVPYVVTGSEGNKYSFVDSPYSL